MAKPLAHDELMSLDNDIQKAASNLEKAQQFLEEHGADIHPIFEQGNSEPMDSISRASTLVALSPTTQRRTEEFLEVMDTHKSDHSLKLVDLRAKHTWNEMITAANDAHQRYEAAGNTSLRKAGHYLTAHSESAQPFLRLIPNDFYLSILYGGLRLVFEAFSQVHEKRLKVLKSFLRIPSIILMAESCVNNFPDDEVLFQRAEGVFRAALPAIEGTIRWLKQNPAMKPIRALVMGSSYTKSYTEKMGDLDDALHELEERTAVLRDQSIQKTKSIVDDVHHVVKRTDTQMLTLNEDLKHITKTHEETRAKVDSLNDLEQVKEQAKEAIRVVFEQTIRTSQWMQEHERRLRRLKKKVEVLERVQVTLTENDLLEILQVGENIASHDFRQIQRAYQSAGIDEIETVSSIMKADRLKQWFKGDQAAALFIEGSFSNHGRTTPLSFACSQMVEMLRDREPAVPVYFFCAPHTTSRDTLRGPSGIMRSLLSQVIRLYPPKLDFISRRYREQLEALHLYTLCDCFCKLVRGLPNDTLLFCIVDGISFFETKEWARDCTQVMSHLQELQDDDDLNPVFKLLVTSPTRSRYAGIAFPPLCRWNLATADAINVRHRLTERDFAMSNSRSGALSLEGSRPRPIMKRKRIFFKESEERVQTSQDDSDTASDDYPARREIMSGQVSEMETNNRWAEVFTMKRTISEPDLSG